MTICKSNILNSEGVRYLLTAIFGFTLFASALCIYLALGAIANWFAAEGLFEELFWSTVVVSGFAVPITYVLHECRQELRDLLIFLDWLCFELVSDAVLWCRWRFSAALDAFVDFAHKASASIVLSMYDGQEDKLDRVLERITTVSVGLLVLTKGGFYKAEYFWDSVFMACAAVAIVSVLSLLLYLAGLASISSWSTALLLFGAGSLLMMGALGSLYLLTLED